MTVIVNERQQNGLQDNSRYIPRRIDLLNLNSDAVWDIQTGVACATKGSLGILNSR